MVEDVGEQEVSLEELQVDQAIPFDITHSKWPLELIHISADPESFSIWLRLPSNYTSF